MHYKYDNLPKDIRDLMLSELYRQPKFKALEKKAAIESMRATAKLRSVIQLGIMKRNYLMNALKEFGSDEAVDKFYADNHKELYDVCKVLSDEDSTKFDNTIHSLLFALDLLDTYVATINELVNKAYPGLKFYQYDFLLAFGKEARAMLKDFHSDKSEGHAQCFADEADKIHDYIEKERMPVFLRKLARIDKKNPPK